MISSRSALAAGCATLLVRYPTASAPPRIVGIIYRGVMPPPLVLAATTAIAGSIKSETMIAQSSIGNRFSLTLHHTSTAIAPSVREMPQKPITLNR